METSVLNSVVKLLESDEFLLRERKRFFHALDIRSPLYYSMEQRFNLDSCVWYEYHYSILSTWVSKNGSGCSTASLKEILDKEGFKSAAERLENIDGTSVLYTFGLHRVPDNFTGRVKELTKLQDMFYTHAKLIVITGLGGVGKTTLAMKFASIVSQQLVDCVCLNGEDTTELRKSVQDFADQVDTRFYARKENEPISKIFYNAVTRSLKRNKFVLVIDNVDQTNEDVISLFNIVEKEKVFVIVTSRDIAIMDFEGERMHLDTIGTQDCIQMVTMCFPGTSVEDGEQLCRVLENYPLAIQQAIAYIKERKLMSLKGDKYNIQDYLKQYKKQQEKLLKQDLSRIQNQFKQTTFTTLATTISKLQSYGIAGKVGLDILKILAYSPSFLEYNILKRIFDSVSNQDNEHSGNLTMPPGVEDYLKLCSNSKSSSNPSDSEDDKSDEEILLEGVELLKRFSIVTVKEILYIKDYTLSIHRLVQEVTRLTQDSELSFLKCLLQGFSRMAQNNGLFRIRNQGVCIWKHALHTKNVQLISEFVAVPVYLFAKETHDIEATYLFFKKILGLENIHVLKLAIGYHNSLYTHGNDCLETTYKVRRLLYKVPKNEVGKPDLAWLNILEHLRFFEKNNGNIDEGLLISQILFNEYRKLDNSKGKALIFHTSKENPSFPATSIMKQYIVQALVDLGTELFDVRNYNKAVTYFEGLLGFYSCRFDGKLPFFTTQISRKYAVCLFNLGQTLLALDILTEVVCNLGRYSNFQNDEENNRIVLALGFILRKFYQPIIHPNSQLVTNRRCLFNKLYESVEFAFLAYEDFMKGRVSSLNLSLGMEIDGKSFEILKKLLTDMEHCYALICPNDRERNNWIKLWKGICLVFNKKYAHAVDLLGELVSKKTRNGSIVCGDRTMAQSKFALGVAQFELNNLVDGGENMIEGYEMLSLNVGVSRQELRRMEDVIKLLFRRL